MRLALYSTVGTPRKAIMATRTRQPSLPSKYNTMIDFAIARSITFDAVIVHDDDDKYAPLHSENHVKILQTHAWSKPSRIISEYFNPPKEESGQGRFHGSIAIRRDKIIPWVESVRATFDQEQMQLLQSTYGDPGDPCTLSGPTYTYRWQTSRAGHCSGLMGSPTWYADYRPDSREPIERLWPEFDEDTEAFINSTRLRANIRGSDSHSVTTAAID